MKSKVYTVDVYSSPTIDYVRGSIRPGGPGFYVAKALYQANVRARLRLIGCGGKPPKPYQLLFEDLVLEDGATIVFEIEEEGFTRTLRLVSACRRRSPDVYAGDLAIVSPTYWDVSTLVHDKALPSYRLVVLDLQGFTRLGRPEIERTAKLARHFVSRRPRLIVRASYDDFAFPGEADHVAEAIDVLTVNGYAILVRDQGRSYLVSLGSRVSGDTVGAGDAFDAYMGLAVLEGYTVLESALIAHAATTMFLQGLSFSFDPEKLLAKAMKEVRVRSFASDDTSTLLNALCSIIC